MSTQQSVIIGSGLRSMSLSRPHRYKSVCICNGILNKAGDEVQVAGYRVTQVLSILRQVPSCCVRKEEE